MSGGYVLNFKGCTFSEFFQEHAATSMAQSTSPVMMG
jgi:hypothetical protein